MNLMHYINKILLKFGLLNNSPLRKGKNCNFIFIHINKTGGTSIARAIGLPKKRHLTAQEVINIIGKYKWEKAYKFSFVRNPWDKVVSHYNYRIKTNQNLLGENSINFKEWVKLTYGKKKDPFYYDFPKMFQPQIKWLKDENGNINMDFIGRLENIHEDFSKIKKEIPIKKDLPHLNKTKRVNYRDFYDEETKAIVADWFAEDIEMFGYNFNN